MVSKLSSLRRGVFEMKKRIQSVRIQAVSRHTQFDNWLRDSEQNICSSVGQQIQAAQKEVDQATVTRRLKTQRIKNRLHNMNREVLSLRSNVDQIRDTILKNTKVSRNSSKHLFGLYSSKILALTTHWSKAINDRDAHGQVSEWNWKAVEHWFPLQNCCLIQRILWTVCLHNMMHSYSLQDRIIHTIALWLGTGKMPKRAEIENRAVRQVTKCSSTAIKAL